MQVKGIIWVGTPTDAREQLATFFHDLPGMSVTTDAVGFTRLSTANGDRIEIFGPESSEYVRLDTGPVAGLWVDDARAARRELIAAGVDSCTALDSGPTAMPGSISGHQTGISTSCASATGFSRSRRAEREPFP